MQYIMTNTAITITDNGKTHTISSAQPNFNEVCAAILNNDMHRAIELCDMKKAIKWFTGGSVILKDNTIWYNAEKLDNVIVDKILYFMKAGYDYSPLLNFLKKIVNNPSENSREQLYNFLAHKSLPITPEGDFFAYKGVRSDYMDIYSGRFSNRVGAVISCNRDEVVDDPDVHCAAGFHVGTYAYASGYAGLRGRLMLARVNPADAVSVPNDVGCQKLRVCKYKIERETRGPVEQSDALADCALADW